MPEKLEKKNLESENPIHYLAIKVKYCYKGLFSRINISLYRDLPVVRIPSFSTKRN